MYLFFTATLHHSDNYLIRVSQNGKFHKSDDYVPPCSPQYPENLAQWLVERRCHWKNKGREEIGHSIVHRTHQRWYSQFYAWWVKKKKKRLGTLGETFQLCKSAQSLPRKKVVTINIQPLALTLSIKEDSHRTEERDASKLYTKWPGKWATNIVTVGHSQVSLFSPSTSPCLELKQMKAEFPVTLLFPHMWTSWEHILPKTVLGERHFPKSHMAF